MTKDSPVANDPKLEYQLETVYNPINWPSAIRHLREHGSDTTPRIGLIAQDVLKMADFDMEASKDFTRGETPEEPEAAHGTLTAAAAGALTNNDLGIAGTSDAELYVAQIGANHGYEGTVIEQAFDWCIEHNVDTISMSFGLPEHFRDSLKAAVSKARENGVLVVAAAGNSGDTSPRLPLPQSLEQVFSVGSTDGNGNVARFSTHGDVVNIAAPGVEVLGYVPDNLVGDENDNPGQNWELMKSSGTSFSAPIVAGVDALMVRANPKLRGNNETRRKILTETATNINAEKDIGAGRVDAFAAVKAASDPVRYSNDY